jgi:hypothetical protein
MFSVVGVIILTDYFLPKNWAYSWTQAQTPSWANMSFLWSGLIAAVTFIHACITTQTAAITDGSTERERQMLTKVYRVSAACSAGGALCGTLLAFLAAAQMPSGMKLTALVSDLTMVGTVTGLAMASPFYIFHTWRTINRLKAINRRSRLELIVLLSIFDAWISDRIIPLMPDDWGFLRFFTTLV